MMKMKEWESGRAAENEKGGKWSDLGEWESTQVRLGCYICMQACWLIFELLSPTFSS